MFHYQCQQTLRSLIDWSYDLLQEPEKALLRRLSVFSGGWTLEAAAQICSGLGAEGWQMLDLLTSLSDKSLVVSEQSGDQTRYRLLETVKQYARDRLLEAGDGEQWRDRHLEYFLALVESAEPHFRGAGQQEWLGRLELEHDNVRTAMDWPCEQPGRSEFGLRLATAMRRFWATKSYFSEGRNRLARFLALEPNGNTQARERALNGAGLMASRQGDYKVARALFQESLAIGRLLDNRVDVSATLHNLGLLSLDEGEYSTARTFYEESLSLSIEVGDRWGSAVTLNNLGIMYSMLRDFPSAREIYLQSLQILRELSDRLGIASTLSNLGEVEFEQKDYAAAEAAFRESLTTRRDLGDRRGIAITLEGYAALRAAQREPLRAAKLWGAAERLREDIGVPVPHGQMERHSQQISEARSASGDDAAFDAAMKERRSMVLEHAIELAF